MKGTVVATWVATARKVWGDTQAEAAMTNAGWEPGKLFLPTEDVPDNEPRRFVTALAQALGKTEDDVWLTIGKDNIHTFFETYPAFFQQENLYSFLRSMYDVHVVVVKRMPGATPPELLIEPVSEYEAVLSYRSRRGMFGYLKGLLAGAAEHFHLLAYGLALVLMFIGTKMLIAPWWHVPVQWSLATVGGLIVSSVVLSLALTKGKTRVAAEQ